MPQFDVSYVTRSYRASGKGEPTTFRVEASNEREAYTAAIIAMHEKERELTDNPSRSCKLVGEQ